MLPILFVVVNEHLNIQTSCQLTQVVHFDESHLAVEVKSEKISVNYVFFQRNNKMSLRQQTSSFKVLNSNLMLQFTCNFSVNVDRYSRKI